MRLGSICGVCGLLLGAALAAGEAPGLDPAARTEITRLAALHQEARTVQGRFSYRVRRAGSAEAGPVRRGEFAMELPARYNLVLRGADGTIDRFLGDGSRRWEVSWLDPEEEPVIKGPQSVDPQDDDFRRLLACVRLDLTALERDHHLAGGAVDGGWNLELRPRPVEGRPERSGTIRIRLGKDGLVKRVEIEDGQGERTEADLEELVYDRPLAAELFRPPR